MAWTTPRTWVTNEVVTATLLNTHLRDNLVVGMDRGTSLPGSPVDGQFFCYIADATNGVEWLLKYNTGDAGSYKWHFIGGSSLWAQVTTAEALSSTTYAALATAGPSITLPLAGDYVVQNGYRVSTGGSAADIYMSYDIGGSGAADADAHIGGNTTSNSGSRVNRKTALGAVTLTSKYRVSANSTTLADRWLQVTPVRVG